jgi:hypothetical protein
MRRILPEPSDSGVSLASGFRRTRAGFREVTVMIEGRTGSPVGVGEACPAEHTEITGRARDHGLSFIARAVARTGIGGTAGIGIATCETVPEG